MTTRLPATPTTSSTCASGTLSVDGTNTFDGVLLSTATDVQIFAIEDKIVDAVDVSGYGLVQLKANNIYVTPLSFFAAGGTTTPSIQRGIDAASAGNTVNVEAGTYMADADYADAAAGVVDGLNIDKPLTILVCNAGIDPNTGVRGAETIIVPGNSDPDPYDSTAFTVVGVNSSNVTIDGLTIDGSNSAPGFVHALNAPVLDGNTIDASEGISSCTWTWAASTSATTSSRIPPTRALTSRTARTIACAATANNYITNNLIENLSDHYGFGVGVILYDNFYASVTQNVMQNVFAGVQTGNFSQANPGGAAMASISNNQISAGGVGIFYNLMYGASGPFSVDSNTITATYDVNGEPWQGVLLTSIQDAVKR